MRACHCLASMARSMASQPMRPGYSSQNSFRSNAPSRGFSSRPMKKSYTAWPGGGQSRTPQSCMLAPRMMDSVMQACRPPSGSPAWDEAC